MELNKKLAIYEISQMVSHLKKVSSKNTSWSECLRQVHRNMPSKWKKENGEEYSEYKKAYILLSKEYEKIDNLQK